MISQTALDHFRTSLSERKNDPYSVLLRRNKLPMALLDDAQNPHTQKVHFSIDNHDQELIAFFHFSDLILSKLSLSRKHSDLRLKGNGPESMQVPLKNLEN